jgi:cysteinyl-tRNA synthetase
MYFTEPKIVHFLHDWLSVLGKKLSSSSCNLLTLCPASSLFMVQLIRSYLWKMHMSLQGLYQTTNCVSSREQIMGILLIVDNFVTLS